MTVIPVFQAALGARGMVLMVVLENQGFRTEPHLAYNLCEK